MPADALSHANTFQRLMRQWEAFAPYNAGQFMTLDRTVDANAVQASWEKTVVGLGLDAIGQRADRVPRSTDRESSDAGHTVEAYVTTEMNRPFADGDSPLRPFLIAAESGQCHVGVIYRHVVADSASIRWIMRVWFDRLTDRRLALSPIARSSNIGRRLSIAKQAAMVVREIARLRRVKRVRRLNPSAADPTGPVAWRRVPWPDGTIDTALAYCRARGVKLNDVFVAAAVLACRHVLPTEASSRRTELGVGTIVDVRPADRPPQTHFGLSLGFLQTFWTAEQTASWDDALRVAAATSQQARVSDQSAASLLRLKFAERFCRHLASDAQREFYRKRCPLMAGISNVNLNRDWPAEHHPSPLVSYTRVSPLGPMLPIVFTPTTLGSTANLGVTWRTSALDHATAERVIAAFVQRLQNLTSSS